MGKKLGTYYTYETPDGKFGMLKATDKSMLQRFLNKTIVGYKKTFISKKEAKALFEEGKVILIGVQTTSYSRFLKAEENEDFDTFDARVRRYFNNYRNIRYREPLDNGESLKLQFR